VFFVVLHAVALIGTPLYIYHRGLTGPEIALFLGMCAATGLSITVGYHRLFAHSAFKAAPAVQFFVLLFGAGDVRGIGVEMGVAAPAASSLHGHGARSVRRQPGLLARAHRLDHVLAPSHELRKREGPAPRPPRRLAALTITRGGRWAAAWSFRCSSPGGSVTRLGGIIMAVALRIVVVLHSSFFINSFAHTFGTQPYDGKNSARDNWIAALLTNGEGFHNFHHRFPNDYRNGWCWYHWDPSKWLIFALSKCGLAWDLRKTSDERIAEAAAH
jgi:stearoyl-CoA desaturase (delta-9 desaturase)